MKNSFDLIKVKPFLSEKGRYGLMGKFMGELSIGTEAIPEFMGAEFLSYISASIQRGFSYVKYGTGKTEPRCNALLVADSGAGKGISSKQLSSVIERVSDKEVLAPKHTGGLSTTEGIVNRLRDDIYDNEGNIIEGVSDKRLFVSEEEFANVLTHAKKGNSTLSATIRCLFDGGALEPLIKNNPIGCARPHVVIYAHITPNELLGKLDSIEISNGFLNRFPIFYGSIQPDVPFPKSLDNECVQGLAEQLEKVLKWGNEKEREFTYSGEYKKLWEENYSKLRNLGAKGSIEGSLLTRARHYASMYAMVFAITDCSTIIDAKHLEASLAWIDYWHQSVKYIYDTEFEGKKAEELIGMARDVYKGIVKCISDNGGNPIGKSPLTKHFSGRFSAQQISDSLKFMQELPRPPIKVTLLPRNKHEISLLKYS
ncbi:hypothetical protein ACSTJ7_12830 [Vibrio parahaemolyticus]|uniref:hypothetical protein n=1 Tax=Vibrio parahaemolyticus TaxID=670 RepID=UPI00111D72C6|nr:hypothetical protein [Vibrio parahaemolyticus]TOF98703.1 hypothetical protein CGJ10_18315 [Vibrio parahaemolyticus]HCG7078115.1 hypothetical protein [Vibrio parahaemolyticus]HCG8136637.1 hypothetical protein [Vibrio parahaemolyticus]HCG8141081.1 hypothetical protein [Vibrio parahaemolyticus]